MVVSVLFEVGSNYGLVTDSDPRGATYTIGKIMKAASKTGHNIKPLGYKESTESVRGEILRTFESYPGSNFNVAKDETQGYIVYKDTKADNAKKISEEKDFKKFD